MADLYNLTGLKAAQTITDIVKVANDAYPTGAGDAPQLLVTGFLAAIFMVILMSLRRYEFEYRIMAASWVCFVLSMFLRLADLIPMRVSMLLLAISGLTTLYIYMKK